MSYHVLINRKYVVAAYSKLSEEWGVKCEVITFLHTMSKDANYASNAKKFKELFIHFSEEGPSNMTSGMWHEVNKANSIMEFIKGSLRILCFMDGNTVILTNGYIKKGQKVDSQAVQAAIDVKNQYQKGKAK